MLRALVSLALCIASVKAAAMLRSGYATDAEIVAGNVTTTSSSDYYVFALQQCESHSAFTIHGLWPEWGQYCTSEAFDVSQISSLVASMETLWPSCPQYGQTDEEFWSHEWSKHGTCSGLSQYNYFSEGLSLCTAHRSECVDGQTCELCFTTSFKEFSCP